MILEAHSRDGRDVLISNAVKAFIGKKGERRELLEAFCRTRIFTVDEFIDYAGGLEATRRHGFRGATSDWPALQVMSQEPRCSRCHS